MHIINLRSRLAYLNAYFKINPIASQVQMASSPCCSICVTTLEKNSDFNLIESSGQFNPLEIIRTLPFIVLCSTAKYICKRCKSKLKTLSNLRGNVFKAEEDLRKLHQASTPVKQCHLEDSGNNPIVCPFANTAGSKTSNSSLTEKRTLESDGTAAKTSSSKKNRFAGQFEKAVQTNIVFHADKGEPTPVECYVYASWQSCDRIKKLAGDLLRIGVSLLRGTYKDIAVALWKNLEIRKNIVDLFIKEVNKECD